MQFSVVIPFRNTNQARERNIRYLLAYYRKHLPSCELIVTEQDTATDLISSVDRHLLIRTGRELFSRAQGFNEGFRVSSADWLVLADADCVPESGLLSRLAEQTSGLDGTVLIPYRNPVHYLDQQTTERFIADRLDNVGDPAGWTFEAKKHAQGGVVIIKTEVFCRLGGFDPRYLGWGYEDDAFIHKNQALGVAVKRTDNLLVHLHHPDTFQGGSNYSKNRDTYESMFRSSSVLDQVNQLGLRHLGQWSDTVRPYGK